MSYEVNHECNNCVGSSRNDECYCEKCRDEYAEDAYNNGQEAGYKEGYAAAERELAKDE